MRFARLAAVLRARNREFLRDRSALVWNILLPSVIVPGFEFAFSGNMPNIYKIGVIGRAKGKAVVTFLHTRHIEFILAISQKGAINKVRRHQLNMLLDLKHDR